MTTNLLLCVIASTVISAIVDFAKPMWRGKVGNWGTTIANGLAFVLGIIGAFAILPYLSVSLNGFAIVLVGLALGTGATVIYKVLDLVKSWADKLK